MAKDPRQKAKLPKGEIKAGFDKDTVDLRVDQIVLLKVLNPATHRSPKYGQILASIREVGIIEPPVVILDIDQGTHLNKAALIGIRLEGKAAESIRHEFKRRLLLEFLRKKEQVFLEIRVRQKAAEGAKESNQRLLAIIQGCGLLRFHPVIIYLMVKILNPKPRTDAFFARLAAFLWLQQLTY